MAEQITWENETHWRTSDIQRIVRLAMAEADADVGEPRVVTTVYTKAPPKAKKQAGQRRKRRKPSGHSSNPSVANITFHSSATTKDDVKVGGQKVTTLVTLHLPRRGSTNPHPVAMVALAANRAVAGKVDEDDTLLAFSDVYFMANYLAYQFAYEASFLYEDENGELVNRWQELRSDFREVTAPTWADPSKLFIAKYRDPLKDATYLAFVKKKRTAIRTETTRIAAAEKVVTAAQKRLRDARKRKKAAEKAIKDATERRTA